MTVPCQEDAVVNPEICGDESSAVAVVTFVAAPSLVKAETQNDTIVRYDRMYKKVIVIMY